MQKSTNVVSFKIRAWPRLSKVEVFSRRTVKENGPSAAPNHISSTFGVCILFCLVFCVCVCLHAGYKKAFPSVWRKWNYSPISIYAKWQCPIPFPSIFLEKTGTFRLTTFSQCHSLSTHLDVTLNKMSQYSTACPQLEVCLKETCSINTELKYSRKKRKKNAYKTAQTHIQRHTKRLIERQKGWWTNGVWKVYKFEVVDI